MSVTDWLRPAGCATGRASWIRLRTLWHLAAIACWTDKGPDCFKVSSFSRYMALLHDGNRALFNPPRGRVDLDVQNGFQCIDQVIICVLRTHADTRMISAIFELRSHVSHKDTVLFVEGHRDIDVGRNCDERHGLRDVRLWNDMGQLALKPRRRLAPLIERVFVIRQRI